MCNKTAVNKYHVFVNAKGQYVAVRRIHLAFGNVADEIYFVNEIQFAEKFYRITKLKANQYYHKFPDVLKFIVDNLECKLVTTHTTFELSAVEDET